ncbi:histidine phosphatase superfamily [Nemania sp. FL0031]|nr:histidine phosphatase superfamily [Nemania sp. FL0031]
MYDLQDYNPNLFISRPRIAKMTTRSAVIPPYVPDGLNLEQVHILMRHGERTPVVARFQNAGLTPYWPYCSAAQRFSQLIMTAEDGSAWGSVAWRRRFDTTDPKEKPAPIQGAVNESRGICMPGELTDKGRATSLAFGKQLRQLYVDQLGLLPKNLSDPGIVYARTTAYPRVLESVQQALYGLYPPSTYKTSAPWDIVIRSPDEETLLPHMKSCARLAELTQAFSKLAAAKWNGSDDVKYLSEKLGKWLPKGRPLSVDSKPRLSDVMDTLKTSIAHGPETRLPDEFYEERVHKTIERIVIDERFYPYSVSRELRKLGAGEFMGGIVQKMVDQAAWKQGYNTDSSLQLTAPPKLSLLGCHDFAFGGALASLGCLDSIDQWPPFTGNITFELFRKSQATGARRRLGLLYQTDQQPNRTQGRLQPMEGHATTKVENMLDGYYVRVKSNGRILTVPGCRPEGNHLDGDESVCTLSAFKSIVDKFTPKSWQGACNSNLGAPLTIDTDEVAGY